MAHERDVFWQPLRQSLYESLQGHSHATYATFSGWGGQGTAEPYRYLNECRDYNALENVRIIKTIMMFSLAAIAMGGCLSRPKRISSYLPMDRVSACFLLVGAAQGANSDSSSGPVLFVGEPEWWCGMLIYLFVCFKLFGRTARTIVQIMGFVFLSRWEGHVKLAIVICLGVGLFISAEKRKLPRGGHGLRLKANKPSSTVSDRTKMFEEVIFRFAALAVVLICYPHVKFDETSTRSGTYPGELLYRQEYHLIGEVVRVGVSQPDCGRYSDAPFAVVLYGRVFGTTLFKACQASLAYLMARMLVTLPVFLGVFPRCKCALATITTNVRSSSFGSNAGPPDRKPPPKGKPDHNEGDMEQPGNGDSKEDVALRIQLRSMHRVLAAAVIIVAIDAAFDPYSRLRNEQRGLCLSGWDDESCAHLHERLWRDLGEVTAACFAIFTVAITRGAQEELAFALALCGPSRDRDLLTCVRVTLAGAVSVAFGLYVGVRPFVDLIDILPYDLGRSYGTAVVMAYYELTIAVALAILPCWNLVVSFLCGLKVLRVPRWLEDVAILASSATVQNEIIYRRLFIIRLSRKLLYYPVADMALWVPWNIGKAQGLMDLLPELFVVVYEWCSLFEIGVDLFREFLPFCWPASRHLRLGLVSRAELFRARGSKEMFCSICMTGFVDRNGIFTPGLFGDGAGEGAGIPGSSVSSTVGGGVTAAAPQTFLQSRCSCKRFLHADCAATWLKVSPRCHRCQENLHGGLDLWRACSRMLAFIVPTSIRSLARKTWWSWTESALVKGQNAATFFFDRRLPWGRKEYVLHRQDMLAFGAFVDALLEIKAQEKRSNSLLEKSVRGNCSLNTQIQVEQAKAHNAIAAVSQEHALIREAHQLWMKRKAAGR